MGLSTLNRVSSLVSLVLFFVFHCPLYTASSSTEEARLFSDGKPVFKTRAGLSCLRGPSTSKCNQFYSSETGISCNHSGSVLSITLINTSLKGTLHEFSFSLFSSLAYLDLGKNEIFGTIPPQIGYLSTLKYLDLSANQFSGKIPPEIGLLTHLEVLYLADNQLNGSILQEVL
ncbi:MDIS1-interacting receptor like kinase 2-like [Pistacia vera]|uniref:MDIS1-interacting receptor like kinase 2-like n=1 Tax=Pistacia vera TaxID=55513 RepID=UPI0012634CEC|nr:MDIS1-interacting receptor like kinase 2-like [Pistacia vera]